MAAKRRKLVSEDFNFGIGATTIPTDSGGTRAATKFNLGALFSGFTVPFSATPAFDLQNGITQTITLTANVSSSTIVATGGTITAGTRVVLRIIQDGTGGRTFAWPANVGIAIPISRAANAVTRVELSYNGATWELVGPSSFAGGLGSLAALITGSVGSAGTFRTDVGIEIQRATDAGLSLLQASNPGSTTYETFITGGAYDDAGTVKKTFSISSKWASAVAGASFATIRFNVAKVGGEAVEMRIFGGQGIDMFGASETVGPGDKIFHVEGKGWFDTAIGLGVTPSLYPIQVNKDGTQISGNIYAIANLLKGDVSKGVNLGYDTSSLTGIIASHGANSGLAFWTHNGSWARRVAIDPTYGHLWLDSGVNFGIGTIPAASPFQIARDGSQISGNAYAIATLLNAASSKGVNLGYDNASALGLICSQGANSGLSFWSHNGAWAERFQIATDGTLVFGDGTVDVKFKKALVALGGGAAPTLGTIGGSGPAAAGQNSWKREVDSTGAAYWVPVWK